ncbi:capsid protein, partial [Bacillus cereus]
MPNLNYAELYSQGLQQRFAQGLYFTELYNTPNNSRIKWVNAKTIQIPRIDVTGMTDYNREDIGTFSRQVDNSWETKTLGHDREFRTMVDPVDVDETNMAITIANI